MSINKESRDMNVSKENIPAKFNGRVTTNAQTQDTARRLVDEEEALWLAILGNRSKRRVVIAAIEKYLEEKGAEVTEETSDLLAKVGKGHKSSKERESYLRSRAELIDNLRGIDPDRKIVAAAKDEIMKRRSDGQLHRTRQMKAIEEAERRVFAVRCELIEANQGLVCVIANRFTKGDMPFYDRVQEGNIGLIKAVNRFDYKLGYKFSTYASWWIRSAIGRAISTSEFTVRVPSSAVHRLAEFEKKSRKIELRTGRGATDEEIAEETGVDPKKVSRVRSNFVSKIVSLDEQIPGSDNLRYIDAIPDESMKDPGELTQRKLLFNEVGTLLSSLTQMERNVIEQRFGLGNEDGATLREIGKRHALSRERIRQIQNKALKKLRERMNQDAA